MIQDFIEKVRSVDELALRDLGVPTPTTPEELNEIIDALIKREHDYGTCVYAMSMASVAAFNFVASKLGVTGFQAGCADLDIVRRTRHIKSPFMVISLQDALFPQYDLISKTHEFIENNMDWLQNEAKKYLEDRAGKAAPTVEAHWRLIADKNWRP
jgi:hypothetical protein